MTEQLTRPLDEAGINYEVLPHEHTESAAEEAQALGVEPTDVAKTLIVSGPEGNVRAVVPASERLDLHKLAEACEVGRNALQLASEDDLASFASGAQENSTTRLGVLGRVVQQVGKHL